MSDGSLWSDENYGRVAHKVCWALVAITSSVIALRFYARIENRARAWGNLGLDDGLTLFAWIVLMITQIFIQVAAGYGLGQHYDTLSRSDQIEAMKWNTIIDATIIWAFSLPKLAIIALLKRILNYGLHTSVLFWGLAFIGQAFMFAMSVFIFVQCSPVTKNWDKDIPGTCLPTDTLIGIEYFSSSWSAFLDLFFALYPVPFIMRLNMPLKTRLAVSAALGLGVFASIVQGYKLSIMGLSFELTDADPTFPIPYLNTLGMTEACLLLIAGSLPAIGPVFRNVKVRIGSWTGYSGSSVAELLNRTPRTTQRSVFTPKPAPTGFIGHDIDHAPPRKESDSSGRTLSDDVEKGTAGLGSPQMDIKAESTTSLGHYGGPL